MNKRRISSYQLDKKKVNEWRCKRDMTVAEFSNAFAGKETHPGNCTRFLYGENTWFTHKDTVKRIAEILHCQVEDIIVDYNTAKVPEPAQLYAIRSDVLRYYRDCSGLSYESIAKLADKDISIVHRWFNKHERLHKLNIKFLAELFKCPTTDFSEYRGEE